MTTDKPPPMTAVLATILVEVADERGRQDERWGEQNHPFVWTTGKDHEMYAAMAVQLKELNAARVAQSNDDGVPSDRNCSWDSILREEVYEALAESDHVRLRHELVQTAAVAVAMIECLDRQ